MLRWLRVLLLLLVFPSLADAGHDPAQAKDSTSRLLGLDLRALDAEELSGAGAAAFAVHTRDALSALSFQLDGIVYVYELGGEGHAATALSWLERLERQGLAGFVARRRGVKPQFFTERREVLALRVRGR